MIDCKDGLDRPLHFETAPVTRWSIFDMDRFVFRGSQSSPPNTLKYKTHHGCLNSVTCQARSYFLGLKTNVSDCFGLPCRRFHGFPKDHLVGGFTDDDDPQGTNYVSQVSLLKKHIKSYMSQSYVLFYYLDFLNLLNVVDILLHSAVPGVIYSKCAAGGVMPDKVGTV